MCISLPTIYVYLSIYLKFTCINFFCSVAQSCLSVTSWTVVHQAPLSIGVLQAGILQWVSMTFSRGSSPPRDQICVSLHVSCTEGRLFTAEPLGKAVFLGKDLCFQTSVDKFLPCPLS